MASKIANITDDSIISNLTFVLRDIFGLVLLTSNRVDGSILRTITIRNFSNTTFILTLAIVGHR